MCPVTQIAKQYEAGGAACLSVLTDGRYFQGSFNFLREIREAGVGCPLLCKEFIVEAYQLYKARACALGIMACPCCDDACCVACGMAWATAADTSCITMPGMAPTPCC